MGRMGRRMGIRGRLTALSVALVALALFLALFVFANLLNRMLSGQLQASVESEAAIIAEEGPAAVAQDAYPPVFRVQLLDAAGNVLYTSTREPTALSALRPGPGVVDTEGAASWWLPGADAPPDLVAAAGSAFDGERYVVLVGTSQAHPYHTVSTTAGIMALASPLILLLAAGLTWWLVGRALGPVEDIRSRVESVTATNLADRVPVPDTGDEVAALASTMNDMLARLEDSRAAQLRFFSDASHELRSPLTAISGALELIDSDPAAHTGALGELLPLVNAEATRLSALVQGMLHLARADAHPTAGPTHGTDVDLDDLARDEVARLRAISELTVRAELSPTRVHGDADALSRALRNLCDNAARHAASTVLITVATIDGTARLTVEDDGAGIDPADRGRVFERFVRLDESRTRDAGGSGLGLAIVHQAVTAHGGTVAVDESPTLGGARFVVELPAGSP